MTLREAIRDISDDEWLAISIHHCLIGKVPKKYITGKVLNYEVIDAKGPKNTKDYVLHRFLVRDGHAS
ncbi:hypothetical protein [Lactococcus lactis]|uniref:Uncharacterized protein n=1 Tax=Lactococcus lactis TaxID=1358 RepID=A0AAP4DTH9_9LACT|nr:hypothetical protein [Lactococcus lactis]MDG4968947.1 hypothetical protein [Lactococcus lactis]MDG4975676.1 hypothetical protein [Lactococcus lactis]MDG5103042.1 hypothetical protein [Lactococcus lactis]